MKSWYRMQLIKQPINFANLYSVPLFICWWKYCERRVIAGMGELRLLASNYDGTIQRVHVSH